MPADSPLVGLVTIWYRSDRFEIERFVQSAARLRYPRVRHVFVVHQQAGDDMSYLRARVPNAVVLEPGRNLGPAAGWNLGFASLLEAGAEYVGVWNADVAYDTQTVERLVAALASDPTVGACQPLLFYSDEPATIQMFGGTIDVRSGLGSHDRRDTTATDALPTMRDAGYLDGGSMLMRADVFRRAGGFDEQLFMYAEDVDLSLRIQHLGYRTIAVRDAHAWHSHRERWGRLPAPHQLFYETRNRFYIVRKHAGLGPWLLVLARAVGWEIPRGLFFYLRRRQVTRALAQVSGAVHGILGLMGKRGWVD